MVGSGCQTVGSGGQMVVSGVQWLVQVANGWFRLVSTTLDGSNLMRLVVCMWRLLFTQLFVTRIPMPRGRRVRGLDAQ